MTPAPDPRLIVEDHVERAYSPRDAVRSFSEALYRVSTDTCGRDFTEQLFARLAGRAAFSRRRG